RADRRRARLRRGQEPARDGADLRPRGRHLRRRIIEIRDRTFEVRATGGAIFLGGLDFDAALIRYVLDDFHAKHGIDLSKDPVAMQRIKDLAERTKIDLSTRSEAAFNIPFIAMTPYGQPL